MPWDDDDLQEWIDQHLGHGNNEKQKLVEEYLDKRSWSSEQKSRAAKKHLDEIDAVPGPKRRCEVCRVPRSIRYLNSVGVCYRCRNQQEVALAEERRLKELQWYLREIRRLKECVKNWESQNPETVKLLEKLIKGR